MDTITAVNDGAALAAEPAKPAEPGRDDGAKRRQIMEGAREAFLAGFDAASMNDVARAAGVSKGTLYAYFDSKEALFEAMIREERAQQPERLSLFPPEESDPAAALRLYARRLADKVMSAESINQIRVVVAASAKFPRLGQAFYEAGPLFGLTVLRERFDAFVAAGSLTIEDTALAARQFVDLCLGDVLKRRLFAVGQATAPDEVDALVEDTVALFLKAYGPPPRG
jgi:AcrR family transcriptional regulator